MGVYVRHESRVGKLWNTVRQRGKLCKPSPKSKPVKAGEYTVLIQPVSSYTPIAVEKSQYGIPLNGCEGDIAYRLTERFQDSLFGSAPVSECAFV
jgi:hypothetical protein